MRLRRNFLTSEGTIGIDWKLPLDVNTGGTRSIRRLILGERVTSREKDQNRKRKTTKNGHPQKALSHLNGGRGSSRAKL